MSSRWAKIIFVGWCLYRLVLEVSFNAFFLATPINSQLALDVQRVVNAIYWINFYPVYVAISFLNTEYIIHWLVIYPVSSAVHRVNNGRLVCIPSELRKILL